MTIDDKKLREFFEEERLRDGRAAPHFRELMSEVSARATGKNASAEGAHDAALPGDAGPRVGAVLRWWLSSGAIVTAAWAAVWVGLLLLQGRTGSNETPPAGVAETTDLDAVCDAALAAIDELESEARMEAATDVLLRPLDLDSD